MESDRCCSYVGKLVGQVSWLISEKRSATTDARTKEPSPYVGDSVFVLHIVLAFRVDLEGYPELVRHNSVGRAKEGFL